MFSNFEQTSNSDDSNDSNETAGKQFDYSQPDRLYEPSKTCKVCAQADQQSIDERRYVCLCKLHYINNRYGTNKTPMILGFPGHVSTYINRCRRWVQVLPKNRARGNMLTQFTITSYNILAQNLLLNNMFLYEGHPRSDLAWSQRAERIKNEILSLNSDILCLQEVHLGQFETDILPSLRQRDYQLIYKQRTGLNQDGCSILFKKSKFCLLDSMQVELKQPDVSQILDRDNVALFVKLRPKQTKTDDSSIIVANTHLLFNPKRGDIKLAQLRLLLAKLQHFANKSNSNRSKTDSPGYYPIIFCGDMNSQPDSPLINFIKTGHVDLTNQMSGNVSGQTDGAGRGHLLTKKLLKMSSVDGNCVLSDDKNNNDKDNTSQSYVIKHMLDFKSVYPAIDEHNLKLISTMNVTDNSLVDYIFYQNHPKLLLSSYLRLMNHRSINKITPIPNTVLGSDHFALSAQFVLLK